MEILNYGSIVPCRDIRFEDGQCDMQTNHPGVVLLPTSEQEDMAFCLYMTSDEKKI